MYWFQAEDEQIPPNLPLSREALNVLSTPLIKGVAKPGDLLVFFPIAIAGQDCYSFLQDLSFCSSMKSIRSLLLVGICSLSFLWTTHAQETSLPANVNFTKVQSARLEWQNAERSGLKLPPYTGNTLLQHSAQARAETLRDEWTVTHQRLSSDGYYNYRSIKSRFADQGVSFNDTVGTSFSESLARWLYSCNKDDCTDTFIKAIKSAFNYFMKEKWHAYQPHYQAIVSKSFTSLGLGIAMSGKKYYLVSHYGKNVVKAKAKPIQLAKAGK